MQRSVSARRVVVSSVAATVLAGLILWPATAAGGHSSSSAAVPLLAGDLDPSFGSAGVVSHSPGFLGAIAVQPDGKIVVAGSMKPNVGFLLARYLPNGSPDLSFGDGGYVESPQAGLPTVGFNAGAVALQPDGKIVVAGEGSLQPSSCEDIEDVCSGFAVARFNSNGSLDTGFGTNGVANTFFPGAPDALSWAAADALAILPDGELVAGGSWSVQVCCDAAVSSSFALAEYTPAGSLDPSFGNGGIVQTAFSAGGAFPASAGLSSLAVEPGGDIVASGGNVAAAHGDDVFETALARYQPDGSLDPTFGTGGQVETPEKLHYEGGPSALQGGKIVAAGFRTDVHDAPSFPVLARFGAGGGHLDPTFGNHGFAELRSLKGEAAWAVATQPDRKILVATGSAVVRLLPNGRPDPSFGRQGTATLGSGSGFTTALAVQADGNVLAGGTLVSADESSYTLTLARLIGGNNCYVPTLRGKTVAEARAKLKASYCLPGGITKLFSNRIARGHVISTTPLPGDRRTADTRVDLVVSRGKPMHHS